MAIVLLPLLASCSLTPSTSRLVEIENEFFDKQDSYVALYAMILEDEKLRDLASSRFDTRINGYYESSDYAAPSEEWFDEENERTSLAEILLDVGLTQERYDRYKKLMATVRVKEIIKGNDGVSFRKESFGILDGYIIRIVNIPGEVSETVWEARIVSSIQEVPLEEEGKYLVPLEGDWYLSYSLSF